MRSGFTLIELLVATVVLTVGVLALASTAALVAAQLGDGARLTHAAHAARTVIDSLATSPCDALASGAIEERGRALAWVVRREPRWTDVELTARVDLRRRMQQHVYRARVPCEGE